jgi:light-regulated signal transduction histidine kinase (bacteriophytochrome)
VTLSDGSLIGIGIDITERKRAEERNRLYLEQLEWSNKELQDFAFAASHDLQEPLRKIQSFGDLLSSEFSSSISEEGRDYLARMQNAAARMRDLIDSLLAYSRVTTQIRPFFDVALGEAVEEALANLVVRMEETNASVEVAELPIVEGDKVQIVQLFQNLIGNALKFHREGEPPRVRIYARPIHDSQSLKGDAYEICVADDGIGFDEAYLSRIFSPFQRLHGRSEYEGVGIGLAICRKIVERHHGRITATCTPGQGAVFMVTLPRRQGEQNAS